MRWEALGVLEGSFCIQVGPLLQLRDQQISLQPYPGGRLRQPPLSCWMHDQRATGIATGTFVSDTILF